MKIALSLFVFLRQMKNNEARFGNRKGTGQKKLKRFTSQTIIIKVSAASARLMTIFSSFIEAMYEYFSRRNLFVGETKDNTPAFAGKNILSREKSVKLD